MAFSSNQPLSLPEGIHNEEGGRSDARTLTLNERRALYACGSNYVTLDQIPTWNNQLQALSNRKLLFSMHNTVDRDIFAGVMPYSVSRRIVSGGRKL